MAVRAQPPTPCLSWSAEGAGPGIRRSAGHRAAPCGREVTNDELVRRKFKEGHASCGEMSFGRQRCLPPGQLGITGVSIVLSPHAWWPRRLVWLLVLLVLTASLCCQLTSTFRRAVVGGTTWTTSTQIQTDIHLPALTICHSNKYKKDVVEAMSREGVSILDWVMNGPSAFSMLRWEEFSLDAFISAASYSWEEMVDSCTLSKTNCSNLGTIETVHSAFFGTCSTLNMDTTVPASHLNGQLDIVLRERNNFLPHEHDGWVLFIHENAVTFSDFALFAGLVTRVKLHANSSISVDVVTNVFRRHADYSSCSDDAARAVQLCMEECVVARVGLDRVNSRVPWLRSTANARPAPRSAPRTVRPDRDAPPGREHHGGQRAHVSVCAAVQLAAVPGERVGHGQHRPVATGGQVGAPANDERRDRHARVALVPDHGAHRRAGGDVPAGAVPVGAGRRARPDGGRLAADRGRADRLSGVCLLWTSPPPNGRRVTRGGGSADDVVTSCARDRPDHFPSGWQQHAHASRVQSSGAVLPPWQGDHAGAGAPRF